MANRCAELRCVVSSVPAPETAALCKQGSTSHCQALTLHVSHTLCTSVQVHTLTCVTELVDVMTAK